MGIAPMPERQLTDWQPIDTAPKDGTPVLVTVVEKIQLFGFHWLQAVFAENVTIAAWAEAYGPAEIGWVTVATALTLTGDARRGVAVRVTPTHWMPLPPPARLAPHLRAKERLARDDLLDGLVLSNRARRALVARGFHSPADLGRLASWSDAEILLWPKVGPKVLREIRRAVTLARGDDMAPPHCAGQ